MNKRMESYFTQYREVIDHVAIHEAAHTIIALLFAYSVRKVEIRYKRNHTPSGVTLLKHQYYPIDYTIDYYKARICLTCAGYMAERFFLKDNIRYGSATDLSKIGSYVAEFITTTGIFEINLRLPYKQLTPKQSEWSEMILVNLQNLTLHYIRCYQQEILDLAKILKERRCLKNINSLVDLQELIIRSKAPDID